MTTTSNVKPPFYVKVALIFISLFALVYTLWIAKSILIPIVYALILAILLNPIVNFFIKHKIPKVLAIGISMLFAFCFFGGIIYLLISQSTSFSTLIPEIKIKFAEISISFLKWFSFNTNINESTVQDWIIETRNNQIDDFAFGKNISLAGQFAATAVLLPVYLYMILYFKPLFIEFIRRLFEIKHHLAMEQVLTSTKKIIQSYLLGLFFELIIIATLNTAGLYVLGIKYALPLGVLGAILNLIPYIGGIIGVIIFMTIALVTKTPFHMFYVLVMYSFIQFIDNNLIIPRVVAARVQINAFISIIVVLIGGAIWGVPGMFLSIPVTAIIKVIFDHIEGLKPWGFLLGDIVPTKKTTW
jgi:predicted PurR-regulated permease PerM